MVPEGNTFGQLEAMMGVDGGGALTRPGFFILLNYKAIDMAAKTIPLSMRLEAPILQYFEIFGLIPFIPPQDEITPSPYTARLGWHDDCH
jgi:hypothetical protein